MTKTEIYEKIRSLKKELDKEIIKVEKIDHYNRRMFVVLEEDSREIIKKLRNKETLTKTDKYKIYLLNEKLSKADKKITDFVLNKGVV